MLRKCILSVAAAFLITFATAAPAWSQTGPVAAPTTVLDKFAVQRLAEARDPEAKVHWDKDGYTITFAQTVKGKAQRVMIVAVPSTDRLVMSVTVSQPISLEKANMLDEQLPTLNARFTNHNFYLQRIAGTETFVLRVMIELKSSLTGPAFEGELDRLLETVAAAQPFWADLR